MRQLGPWVCVALVGCAPGLAAVEATSIEKLTIKSEGGAICGAPGAKTQLIVTATTKDGKKHRTALDEKTENRLAPATFKYKASVGTISRKTAIYEPPDETLQLLAPVLVSAHHADSKDVAADRELDVRFDCDVSVVLRGDATVHVGWLETKRAGRLGFARATDSKGDRWYLLDPKGPGLAVESKSVEVFAEDTESASLIKVTVDGEATDLSLKLIASPTQELVAAAGGMPDEQASASDEESPEKRKLAKGTTAYEGTMTATLSPKRGKPVVKTIKLRGLLSPTDEGHRFELDAKCLIEMTAESKSKGFVFGAKCEAGGMRMFQLDGAYKITGETFRLGLDGKTDNGTVEMSFEGTL